MKKKQLYLPVPPDHCCFVVSIMCEIRTKKKWNRKCEKGPPGVVGNGTMCNHMVVGPTKTHFPPLNPKTENETANLQVIQLSYNSTTIFEFE